MLAPYRRVLAVPHVPLLMLASLVARQPYGVFGVAIVLFLQERTGTFAAGGIVGGAFGLALGVSAPLLGRLIDRSGPTRVLVPCALAYGTFSLALVLLGLAGAPVAVLAVVAALAGAAQPPVSPALRGLWPAVLGDDPARLRTALALDAIVLEAVFVVGPLVAALLIAVASPEAALLVSTAAAVAGTLAFAVAPPARAARGGASRRGDPLGALRARGVRTLLVAGALVGVAFGTVDVALPAFGVAEGAPSAGAAGIAALAVGSAVAGLVYGAVVHRRTAPLYLVAVVAVPLGLGALCLADSVLALLLLAPVAGMPLAPLTASEGELAGELAPPGATTEAYAWVITATVVGYSGGTAMAGVVVDAADWRTALATGAALGLTGALVAVARRGTLSAPASGPLPSPT